MIGEKLVFLREGLVNFYHTGSLFPTTRWAASALTNPLRIHPKPQRILEVGAGTGSVTLKILEEMTPGDSLMVCEVNPRLMGPLRKKLEQNEDYQLLKDNVEFFEGLVQELPEDVEYDIIISALPFLNFEVSTVEDIFGKLSRLSKKDTTLAYYEYIGLRNLGKLLPIPQRRERINALDKFFREQSFARPAGKEQVWYNILPINVYRMHMIDIQGAKQSSLDEAIRRPESSIALSSQ